MDLAAIKAAVKTQVEAVSGMHKVETRRGGDPPWINNPRPLQSYCELEARWDADEAGIGPQQFVYYWVQLHVFMVYSFENPNSTATFDALLAAIFTRLRANRSLNNSVNDVLSINCPFNDFGAFTGDRGEVMCHYARIMTRIRVHEPYTTT